MDHRQVADEVVVSTDLLLQLRKQTQLLVEQEHFDERENEETKPEKHYCDTWDNDFDFFPYS